VNDIELFRYEVSQVQGYGKGDKPCKQWALDEVSVASLTQHLPLGGGQVIDKDVCGKGEPGPVRGFHGL